MPTGHFKMEPAWSGSSDESLSDDDDNERSSASDSLSDQEQEPYWTREAPIIKAAYTGDVEILSLLVVQVGLAPPGGVLGDFSRRAEEAPRPERGRASHLCSSVWKRD